MAALEKEAEKENVNLSATVESLQKQLKSQEEIIAELRSNARAKDSDVSNADQRRR